MLTANTEVGTDNMRSAAALKASMRRRESVYFLSLARSDGSISR